RRRVLHVAGRLSSLYRQDRAVGAKRDRVARPCPLEMEGPRRKRHTAAYAVAQRRVRGTFAGVRQAPGKNSRGEPSRRRNGGAVPRESRVRDKTLRSREVSRQGWRVRRGELRSEGLLPASSRLHHVHSQSGILRRLSKGDRTNNLA